MKTFIVSFITSEGLLVLNYTCKANKLSEVIEDIDAKPSMILSVLSFYPAVNQQEDEDAVRLDNN